MLQKITIKKLFGRFDYNISLSNDGVTILTGPNGFGKSTILKIIEAVSNRDVKFFFSLDFEAISLDCGVNEKIKIKKSSDANKVDFSFNKTSETVDSHFLKMNIRNLPYIRRRGPDRFQDVRTGEIFSESQALFYYDFDDEQMILFDERETSDKNQNKLKMIFENAKQSVGEVRHISEQRLIRQEFDRRREEEKVIESISELPQKLKNQIAEAANEYSIVANKLDSTYPNRLLSQTKGLKNEEEYKKFLEEAKPKFEKMRKYDLADIELVGTKKYKDNFSEALQIYFEDFAQKYKVFESIIDKFELFTKIINERLKFKTIKISREKGIEIIDSTNPQKELNLKNLSSGEKQEIVLFYELIFETNSELLLLIDEPEISLHIEWQKKFLDDLLNVVESSKMQVIVATHSPQIINNHWDIQIDLGELYGN